MKKLIVGLAICALAGITQAATITWSSSKLWSPVSATDGKADGDAINTINGVWGVTLNVYSDVAMQNLIATDFVEMIVSEAGVSLASSAGVAAKSDKGGDASWASTTGITVKLGSDTLGLAQGNYYAVFSVEGVTDTYTANKSNVSDPLAVTVGGTSAKNNFKGADAGLQTSDWTVAAVPEPTSGLLLLLSVAGLALRRRRA